MEDGGFTLVKKGRRSRGGPKPCASAARDCGGGGFRYQRTAAAGATTVANLAALQLQIDAAVAEVERSELWSRLAVLLRPLGPLEGLVCLGVGSFASSASARYQLALALLLRQELQHVLPSGAAEDGGENSETLPRHLDVYDPIFDEAELALLHARGCRVPTRNEEGRRAALRPTLFFMPHCGRQLYANLLQANWGAAPLCRLAVLGNSFGAYADALTDAQRERSAGWCRLTRAAPWVAEQPCGEAPGARSEFANAFNNLSLHTFAPPALPMADDTCWATPFAEPPEDDPLVRRDIIPASAHEGCCC